MVDFFEAFNNHPLFILLGLPGSGKSTLFRRIALAFAENLSREDLHWEGEQKLPMFIRLRNFGIYLENNKEKFSEPGAGAVIAYLEQHLRNDENILMPSDFFKKRLLDGNCLVLFDGLDEVQDNRVAVAQYVNAFIGKYKEYGNRIGISSRPKGYEGDTKLKLINAKLALLEVLPLDKDRIMLLIQKILPLMEKNSKIKKYDSYDLSRKILSNKNLAEIASIPLFCSALVQVYKYHGAELPQRRVDVLSEISDLLLGFWYSQAPELQKSEELARFDGTENSYFETEESVEIKFNRLSYLAYQMHASLKSDQINSNKAQELIRNYLIEYEGISINKANIWASQFLRSSHIHSGLFVEYTPGMHSFLHKNFMEYFAASSLLSDTDDPLTTIINNLDDPWWEEVILFSAAHPKGTNKFREKLIPAIIESAKINNMEKDISVGRIILAGKISIDMTNRLPAIPKKQIISTLVNTAIDSKFSPNIRASCADLADELGYEPEDINSFIMVPNEQEAKFMIARYPVTNAQYERFLNIENFSNINYWINFPIFSTGDKGKNVIKIGNTGYDGWNWLQNILNDQTNNENEGILYPFHWYSSKFGIKRKNAPVVGISWWEANAYCRWLEDSWEDIFMKSKTNHRPFKVRLPTESEWKLAATNQDNGTYPWSDHTHNEEIIAYANTYESHIKRTTSVWMNITGEGQKYKLVDLIGNTWEWQANFRNKQQNDISLRCGSWMDSDRNAGLNLRYHAYESHRYHESIGFRTICIFSHL